MRRIALVDGWIDDACVRCLVLLLAIAVIVVTMPAGGCCLIPAASHGCCRTQCITAAPAAMVKAPTVLAFSIAPVMMRVVAVVAHPRFCAAVSMPSVEPAAPLTLRI